MAAHRTPENQSDLADEELKGMTEEDIRQLICEIFLSGDTSLPIDSETALLENGRPCKNAFSCPSGRRECIYTVLCLVLFIYFRV